jgi:molecular chaperone DnaK
MQFARNQRQKIESLVRELRANLEENNDRGIDQLFVELQDAISDLKREIRQYYGDDEEESLWDSIKGIFTGDDDDYYDLPRRDSYNSDRDYYDYGRREDYSRDRPPSYGDRSSRKRPTYRDNWDDDDDWL